ncbi:hypothetical protein TNCT_331711 [Trichonephila clavata]|uniref:Uncharacterized protein n=1 Tax=Trichonephila clavata TaxID=2740835 RepID=A0A8X6KZV6_TRICU|nr:hypothetical protein TNCT_331711 [Trichonephila clavata]
MKRFVTKPTVFHKWNFIEEEKGKCTGNVTSMLFLASEGSKTLEGLHELCSDFILPLFVLLSFGTCPICDYMFG